MRKNNSGTFKDLEIRQFYRISERTNRRKEVTFPTTTSYMKRWSKYIRVMLNVEAVHGCNNKIAALDNNFPELLRA